MSKKVLIIVGVILVLSVAGVWAYLFFSGKTSTSDGVFAQFGDGGDATNVVENTPVTPENPVVDTTPQRLRQLTFLRPVAGATLTEAGALYVEQGTGHIFHINLASGNETLVSGTTIPGAREAFFSPTGTYIAVTHYMNGEPQTFLGSVSADGEFEGVSLPAGATELAFDPRGEGVYYLLRHESGSRGYSYKIDGANASELFDIPLGDVRVVWGDDTFVYTTPTSRQVGYVYEIVGEELRYVTSGSPGLVALMTNSGLITTRVLGERVMSDLVERTNFIFDPMLPEKCVVLVSSTICAVPTNIHASDFPDVWYKGTVSYNDILWDIDTESGLARVLVNPLQESGREIDVAQIGADETGEKIWFINKNDNSLWLFDSTI